MAYPVAQGYIRLGFSLVGGVGSYIFTVSGLSVDPSPNDIYTNNGQSFTVLGVNISGGSGSIYASGTGTPTASGTLTRSSGSGDATISFSAVKQFIDLKYLSMKGFDSPDSGEFFPPIKNAIIDGTLNTQFKGYRRKCQIVFYITNNVNSQNQVLLWQLDNDRTIDYNSTETNAAEAGLTVVPEDEKGFEVEWINDFALTKKYTLNLIESSGIRTTSPV